MTNAQLDEILRRKTVDKCDVPIVNISKLVGRGYRDFWFFRGRFRVVKGSRSSKKSKTAALWYIYNMMRYPEANTLVIRNTYRTLRDSCFTELKWAIQQLNVEAFWGITNNPLELKYLPTGQKILFRGLDDPLKITSIATSKGHLTWVWIEEAYELRDEATFDLINESIRGKGPVFKQITLTLNPWDSKHWIKKRFFDCKPSGDILAKTTNYLINEYLDESDKINFENMRVQNPKRYAVAGLGEWGISEGLIFDNWQEMDFDLNDVAQHSYYKILHGLDFGYTNDPTGFVSCAIDVEHKKLYVFRELYKRGLTNERIAEELKKLGLERERIVCDSSEPKSIDRLRTLGLYGVEGANKGAHSVLFGIDFLLGFDIIVHPSCVNFINEISKYCWDTDKLGRTLNRPKDDNNHLIDALRYAVERFTKGERYGV